VPDRNLIVIVADTLRDPRPLALPGQSLMPFLDEFKKDGVSIDRLLASSSWTAPAHVALLTGVDPWMTHFQVPGAPRRPPASESLADKWTKAGGVTAAFSANFVVTPVLGTATGYTRFNPGFPAGTAGKLQLALQFLGYERLLYWAVEKEHQDGGANPLQRLGAATLKFGGSGFCKSIGAMRNSDTLVRSLGRFLSARPAHGAKPIHLFINLVEAHEPYLDGGVGAPSGRSEQLASLPSINLARLVDVLGPAATPKSFIQAYRESIPRVDKALQDIVAELKKRGVLDNAVLMFLSDHGQSLGENGFYGHGYHLFDELVKVPAYIWEFRDGRPVSMSAPPEEWVDHRHIFDMLTAATSDGGDFDVGSLLGTSLVRRGPASSYFEGPLPRPPGGFVFKTPQSEIYRVLRIQQGNETALMVSDGKGTNIRRGPTFSKDPISGELEDASSRVLSQLGSAVSSGDSATSELDAKVDARLKSWGYD
jgi:hypothetical protein